MEGLLATLTMFMPQCADAVLIISNENRRYFTGFVSSLGYLLVTRKEAFLLVDSRYQEAAAQQAKNCTVVPFRNLSDSLKELLTANMIRTVMLEGSAFTLNEAAKIEAVFAEVGVSAVKTDELDRIIGKMRIIKTPCEIELMRKAQRITEEALTETMKLIKEGVTEKDLALELEFRMRRAEAESVSFDLIVLTGAKTSMPHGVPGNHRVKNGDFVLFDIGATVDGYHSDMTRTVAFGKVDDTQRRVYQTVYQAQQNGLAAVRDGVTCGFVDDACRSYIDHAGYQGYFGHSTGHGVGLEIHENPSVSPGSDFMLRSGMVVTVEPGIYLPGKFGVRIEDMVVVTTDGCVNLAALPKELIEL